jgi:hypothetical protein
MRSVHQLDKQGTARKVIDFYAQQPLEYAKKLAQQVRLTYLQLCKNSSWASREISLTVAEKEAQKLVPVRQEVFTGPLQMDYLNEVVGSAAVADLGLDGEVLWEIGNFMDGRNSVLDIRNAVSAGFGAQPVEKVMNAVQLLEKANLVKIKK